MFSKTDIFLKWFFACMCWVIYRYGDRDYWGDRGI